jgi:hypothetical protein
MGVAKKKLDIPNANIITVNTASLIAKNIVINNALYPRENSFFSATILLEISNCFRVSALIKELIEEMDSAYSVTAQMDFILVNTDGIYYGNLGNTEKINLSKWDYYDILKFIEDNKGRYKNVFVNLIDMDSNIVRDAMNAMNMMITRHRELELNLIFIADSFQLSRVRQGGKSVSFYNVLKASDKVVEVKDYCF